MPTPEPPPGQDAQGEHNKRQSARLGALQAERERRAREFHDMSLECWNVATDAERAELIDEAERLWGDREVAYCCPGCGHAWQITSDCDHDDECPACDLRAITPYWSGGNDDEAEEERESALMVLRRQRRIEHDARERVGPSDASRSLRDHFAGQALAGNLAAEDMGDGVIVALRSRENAALMAARAYQMADAMLAARKVPGA